MLIEQKASRLIVRIVESQLKHGRPIYELIVEQALSHQLAGATVWRGVEGYGVHHHIHTMKLHRLAEDLPMIIELVDSPDKIKNFLPILDELLEDGGLVTLQETTLLTYHATSDQS